MPNPLFLGIKDKNKKLANKAQNKSTVASAATKTAASAARTTERNTADTDALLSANSKIGNNAEKYENAGRIGGFDRRQTQSTSAASTASTKPTSLESALLQGSARESESNAGLLADALFQSRYATALKKAEASLAKASTAKTSTQTKPTAAIDAVAAHGSMADYVLVKQAADRVDFTDWDKKTTTQQRTALKRSGLSEEAQWTLLNRDGSYLETLSVISDLRDNRMDYGLSAAETEQIGGELLTIAAARANATGNEQPYLSTIPRAQMVKYLDEKKTALLQSIGYLESDTVGGNTPLWYDGEEDGPMPGPSPTLPQVTPNPQAQALPTENVKTSFFDKLQSVIARNRQLDWQLLTGLNPARIVPVTQGAVQNAAKKNKIIATLLNTVETMMPEEKWLEWKKQFNPFNVFDLTVIKKGQEDWEDFVREERELVGRENPQKQTWDESMITNQGVYPSVLGSMGPYGSLQDNGCGPMSLHNVNRILGEDSDFSDVAYEVTRDSSNRTVVGGLLGMDPTSVRPYYEKKGYRVTPYWGTKVEKDHDAYLAMYLYGTDTGIGKFIPTGGHYVAAEYDKENDMFITYNDDYQDYPIYMEDLSLLSRVSDDPNDDKDAIVDPIDPKKIVYIWGIDKRGGKK